MNRKENLKKIEEALNNIVSANALHGVGEPVAVYRFKELFTAVNGLTKDLRTEIENEESD